MHDEEFYVMFKLSDGTFAPFPEQRSLSVKMGLRNYIHANKCEFCGQSKTRTTLNDRCIMCNRYQTEIVRHMTTNPFAPMDHIPEGVKMSDEAVEAIGLIATGECKLNPDPCKRYGHIRLTSDEHTHCYFCDVAPRSERDKAITDGRDTWASKAKCQSCGERTLRSVEGNSCLECGYTPKRTRKPADDATQQYMLNNLDKVISREDAIAQGLKVYRTGKECKNGHKSWRYVSTRNCIECSR